MSGEVDQPTPVPRPRRVLCPYCGCESKGAEACDQCGGRFDPLSRQATINSMGPWFVRDPARAFHPGCSYGVIREMVRAGRITPETVIRGPTTGQFWSLARRTPGVAGLLGICYSCLHRLEPGASACRVCGAPTGHEPDRQHLGLHPMHVLPGRPSPGEAEAKAGSGVAEARGGSSDPQGNPGNSGEGNSGERAHAAGGRRRARGAWIGAGVLLAVGVAAGATMLLSGPGVPILDRVRDAEPGRSGAPGGAGAGAGSGGTAESGQGAGSGEAGPGGGSSAGAGAETEARSDSGAGASEGSDAPAGEEESRDEGPDAGRGGRGGRGASWIPDAAAAVMLKGDGEALRRFAGGDRERGDVFGIWMESQAETRLKYLGARAAFGRP